MTALTLTELDVDLRDLEPDNPESIPVDAGEGDPEFLAHTAAMHAARASLTAHAAASASGLSAAHRDAAKRAAVAAAALTLRKRDRSHYTQGPARWDGIANGRFARRGDFPRFADCSAFVTWCIYQGVRFYDLRDVVNGAGWKAGWTGTMHEHGKPVQHDADLELADAILYRGHTALYVGGGMVISDGSEGGPYLLPIDYRSDRQEARRYI